MGYLTAKEKEVIEEFVVCLKKTLGNSLLMVKLFGSRVREDFSGESDIDILLVVKEHNIKIQKKIFDILFEIDPYYDFKISPVIYSEFEYKKNEEMESPFVENVRKEGISL